MLHKPDHDSTVSTPPVDNPDPYRRQLAAIESAARTRDTAATTVQVTSEFIEHMSAKAIASGCDPVRVRQAAGVL